MLDLLSSGIFSDINIISSDKNDEMVELKCHKFILCARSSYFRKNISTEAICLKVNVQHNSLYNIIVFLYQGTLNFDVSFLFFYLFEAMMNMS